MSAQINCFSGINAGDNTTYCEGETATLDGGYDFYDEVTNDPDLGTPQVTWSVVSGSGTFAFDGATGLTTASNVNFNNSENGITGFPDVTFTPDPGVTEVILQIGGTTSDGPCASVIEVESVTLYFDPLQDTPIDADLEGVQVLDDALGTGNALSAQTGDVVTLTIDENFVIDNGQQFDDIRRYEVSYDGPLGPATIEGLPAAGVYTQNEFEAAFNELTLTNMTCEDQLVTMSVFAFYDRDPANVPQPSGECPGPVTEVMIMVARRDIPVATIGTITNPDLNLAIVCEDDEEIQIVVTGTLFTTVTYNVSYDGGATNGGDQTIVLDGTGVNDEDIVVDATLGTAGTDIIVTLTQIEFNDGEACPEAISKPIVLEVRPVPNLSLELTDPNDAVVCRGTTQFNFTTSTTSGPGTYNYDVQVFLDGVPLFVTGANRTVVIGPSQSTLETLVLTVGEDLSGTLEVIIDGSSITKVDSDGLSCTNPAPDASVSFLIQADPFVEYEASVNNGPGQPLTENTTALGLVICDGEMIDFDQVAPGTDNSVIPGVSGLLAVELSDPDGLLGLGDGVTLYYDYDGNPFEFDQVFDIPNSQTTSSFISATITPFFDDNGNGILDDDDADPNTDECIGDPVTLNIEVRPAPTVTVVADDDLICSGDGVSITITSSEPGTASYVLGEGGAPVEVELTDDGNGGGTATVSFADVTELLMFTVTTFEGDVAGCAATVNQMVMVEVEELPEATVTVDPEDICFDGAATFTLTGSGGLEDGYSFDIFVSYVGGGASGLQTTVMTEPGESSLTLTLEEVADILSGGAGGDDVAPGTYTVGLESVANLGGLMCEADVEASASVDVEDEPIVECDTGEEEPICSGDDYTFTLSAGSALTSTTGSSLYYAVTVTDNTTVPATVTTTYEEATATGVEISGTAVNMTGFDQDIEVSAVAFYFDDTNGAPEAADFDAACQAEEATECAITVRTMPMATFGGQDAVCSGDDVALTFTGPPNGTAEVIVLNEDGSVFVAPYVTLTFDDGGVAMFTASTFIGETRIRFLRIVNTADENGCEGEMTFDFEIEITELPEAEFDGTDATICEGTDETITLSGTPNAVVTVSGDDGRADFDVTLDGDGNGSFTETGSGDVLFSIVNVALTIQDNNGDDIVCENTSESDFDLTVDPAPTGALVSNAVLCAGDEPELQFNATTGDGFTGTYDITVVNDASGEEFNFTVSNGDALVFDPAITLEETTTFSLTGITRNSLGGSLACDNVEDGIGTMVVVNEVPVVTVDPFPATICSGDEVTLTANTATTLVNDAGNALFYQITVNEDFGPLSTGDVVLVEAAATLDLSDALGLDDDDFINPSTTDVAELSLTIVPYYEENEENPLGIEGCTGLTNGFNGGFAASEWVLTANAPATANITADEINLTTGSSNGANATATAGYTFDQNGTVSFDYAFDLEEAFLFSAAFTFDAIIIDFEGNTIFRQGDEFGNVGTGNGSIEEVTVPGSELVITLFGDNFNTQFVEGTVDITNFVFDPACQPCPGEAVDVDLEVLPALFADFDEENSDARVCEGDDATICITGTPDATVSVFLGGGVFVDVKLDGEGNGCFTTVGGLSVDSDFVITGLTTLDSDPECSFTFEAGSRPTATVEVTPTPTASVSIDPATVCAGDEASAEITSNSTEGVVTVTYQIDGGDDQFLELTDGTGSVALSTANETLSDVVVNLTISSISVEIDGVVCTEDLDGEATLTVRPLPSGTLTAGPPVCAGEQGTLFFTATSDLLEGYSITVEDPNGAILTLEGASGGPFLDTDVAGVYTLLSITDGTGTDIGCTRTGDLGSAEIIIEEVPNLAAAISGTAGTANIDSDDEILNAFTALACDMATIETVFSSTTLTSNPDGDNDPLYVQVEVLTNDGLMLGLPAGPSTFTVPFGDLTFAGILDNVDDLANANITVVLTPYFEDGADLTTLDGAEECSGNTLTFNITIIPEVTFEFDGDNSDEEVCAGEEFTIALAGSADAVVTFTADNLDLSDAIAGGGITDNGDGTFSLTLDGAGAGAITGTVGEAGTASVDVMMVLITRTLGNISRQCMIMDQGEFVITVNPNPSATLSVDPVGPICFGDAVDVIVTLGEGELDGSYDVVINGETITIDIVDGSAVAIAGIALTEDTDFDLTLITNNLTGCDTEYDDNGTSVEVELVPNGDVFAIGDAEGVTDPSPLELTICANESIDFQVALDQAEPKNDDAEFYLSVDYSGSPIDFYGIGTDPATLAFTPEDFESTFSTTYGMSSGSPITITLEVTYYIEDDLDDANTEEDLAGDCVGTSDVIIITINPNPKTEDTETMTCSGVALDYDLDEAITNGVVGAEFTYTVSSDDVDVSGLDRTVASGDNIIDVFDNFSTEDYLVTYTVTPFGAEGCQGNDFTVEVTVKPEPVITEGQAATICSGEETLCIILLDNERDVDNFFADTDEFEVLDIVYSLEPGPEFLLGADNAEIGNVGDYRVIAFDEFTNLSSAPQTVTYTVQATSADGCVGDEETITVTILPEPVVADMVIKVCSGGSIDLGFDDLSANGVGDILSFNRSALPLTTLRVFDETGADITLQTFTGNAPSNPGVTAINDSYLNQGTATLSVFYDVEIVVTNDDPDNDDCAAATFILEVQVLEESDVVLEPVNGLTAICEGEPIALVATYDGSGSAQTFEYSFTSDDGVVLDLTPSAAGGEVEVNAVSGSGLATVMVMVTDDNSCVAMATRQVSVGDTPAEVEIDGFEDPCVGTFSFYSVVDPAEGSTFAWSLSNPDAGTFTGGNQEGDDVSITFNGSEGMGPFIISVTETNATGCSTTTDFEVELATETTADFSAEESDTDPLTFDFTELAGGSVEAYIWDFGDGSGTSNDPNPSYTYAPADPAAMTEYTVTLTVLGCDGPVQASQVITLNSDQEDDEIQLVQGINFISFDVAPADNRFDAIMSGVPGVLGVTTVSDGMASFWQPGAGPFNSLQTAEPGYGYVVIMDQDATLSLSGTPIDETFQRPLGMGINYVAFIPEASMAAPTYWAPFEADPDFKLARTFGNNVTPNVQSYFPGFGPFNSMQMLHNGIGYMVLYRDDIAGASTGPELERSGDYEFVFGTVSGDGYRAGDPVEVLNGQGVVIGHLTTDASGIFRATPLYGKVTEEDGFTTGVLNRGENISFRYRGQTIESAVSFDGEFNGKELHLDFSAAAAETGLTVSLQPNPAVERTSVILQLSESTDLAVEAIDATGRIVRTLLPRQTLAAGTTTLRWDDLGSLPAGMYHVVVFRDGRIDTDLTQRLIKR